jgi:hypothetical protein
MKSPREVSLSLIIVYNASSCAVRRSVNTDGGTSYCLLVEVCFVTAAEGDMMMMAYVDDERGYRGYKLG